MSVYMMSADTKAIYTICINYMNYGNDGDYACIPIFVVLH